jgi:hypothetical protein
MLLEPARQRAAPAVCASAPKGERELAPLRERSVGRKTSPEPKPPARLPAPCERGHVARGGRRSTRRG